MRVIILTEGSSKSGFGHIARCSSLYEAFLLVGITPEFIIQGDMNVEYLIKDKRHRFLDWIDKPEILSFLHAHDVVIVDSISVDANVSNAIGKRIGLPVYIDDFNYYEYDKGLVIDWEISSLKNHHVKKADSLLGPKYAALRKEFWDVPDKDVSENVNHLLLTMGGSDVRNLTPMLLHRLNVQYPSLKKTAIIGKGFDNIAALESFSNANVELAYFPDATQMKSAMISSDLAISAGGQTLYELARLGVPTIAVAVADNQLRDIEGWKEVGFIEYAGWWEVPDLFERIGAAITCLNNRNERVLRNRIGRGIVDGLGARRIVEKIIFCTGNQ